MEVSWCYSAEECRTNSQSEQDGHTCVDRNDPTKLAEREHSGMCEWYGCSYCSDGTADDRDTNVGDGSTGTPLTSF